MSDQQDQPSLKVQTYDWKDFIQYGKERTASTYHGMPWAFQFHGLAVTHENNELYLINHPEFAFPLRFTPNDLIAVGEGMTMVLPDAMKRPQLSQDQNVQEFVTWPQVETTLERALNAHSIDSRCNIADYKLAQALVITMKLKLKDLKDE